MITLDTPEVFIGSFNHTIYRCFQIMMRSHRIHLRRLLNHVMITLDTSAVSIGYVIILDASEVLSNHVEIHLRCFRIRFK